MATAGPSTSAEDVSSLEQLLQCPICRDIFTDPKVLDCHHTFCENCLQGVHNASGQSRHVRCPSCRRTTSVPANGIAGLPVDFKMNEMKDRIRQIKTRNRPQGNVSSPSQARPRDNACNPCKASKNVVPASWRCTDCEMMYCDGCMTSHNSNSLFKRHEVRRLQQSTVTCGRCEVSLK